MPGRQHRVSSTGDVQRRDDEHVMDRLAELDDRCESWLQSRSARRLALGFAAVTLALWVALATVVARGGDDRIDTGWEKWLLAAASFGALFVLAGGMTWLLRSAFKIQGGTPARSATGIFLVIAAVLGIAEVGLGNGLAGVGRALLTAAFVGLARYFHARRTDTT